MIARDHCVIGAAFVTVAPPSFSSMPKGSKDLSDRQDRSLTGPMCQGSRGVAWRFEMSGAGNGCICLPVSVRGLSMSVIGDELHSPVVLLLVRKP